MWSKILAPAGGARAAAILVAVCAASAAQAAAPHAAAKARPASRPSYSQLNALPDWSGIWDNVSGIHLDDYSTFTPTEEEEKRFQGSSPPYNVKYAAKYAAVQALAAQGKQINDPTANCIWPGVPRLIWQPYPFEFLFTPGRVTTVHEYMSQIRRIYTDGRKHPDDLEPSYNGHSIGHWEGQTLVVETVGLRGDTMFQNTGMPHSDALKVIERWRLVARDRLEDEVTLIDPKALTRPWVSKRHYVRRPDWQFVEYVCAENNRNPVVDGVTQVVTPK